MFYPQVFIRVGDFELKRLIVPLIQVIMFGMGTGLSIADFTRVFRLPKPVFICMILQFTIMPITGFVLARLFALESEVAAGVILIGSCSAGVASNVMVYLAKGDIALSVTMTTCSTLLAPVMTPLAMKLLAGQYVPISFSDMMIEIINMIILPIVGGLVFNRLLHGRIGFLDRLLPVVSMAGICLIIAIITALSRDKLLQVGPLLIGAAMIHNVTGYVLGYQGARWFGLDEVVARTVAFEVGLQNGGMASGLAINVLRSSDAALAPAIFGPWMNISGSALASYWRGRPVAEGTAETPPAAAVAGTEP
jgi:BASS family bile acid:Na+ symporter